MPRRPVRTSLGVVAVLASLAAALTGCTPTVSLKPAADATAVGCAEIIVRLPDAIDDDRLRNTDAQATAAWGDPASVLLRCGVESPGPTTDRCLSISGVDWIERQTGDDPDVYDYTTYGRDPATTVTVDTGAASSTNVLTDLSGVVSVVEQDRFCVGADDVQVPTPEPTP
ncbi:DUF3515 family protein [Amnibacterium flavum]|uniref:DUF3515 domain-containing protein n=1 Tax=Amnibacterium flavum TaxID=2173173 RepID=A0A2V1HXK3_9MICO|nr:DUF3515 family protein [Amnibacterium flavum]PVZ96040.1 DUF3515 domain-containing protein [Amnibacterium flavum]